MQKLLFSFLFTVMAFSLQAQDKKPTIEETFNYLKENFFNKTIEHLHRHGDAGGINWDRNYFIYEFLEYTMVDCILRIRCSKQKRKDAGYQPTEYPEKEIKQVEIDFSKIESISTSGYSYMGTSWIELKFISQDKTSKLSEILVPFFSMEKDLYYDHYQLKDDKFYKAFNHLRKLCGGPEPIEFD